MGGDDFVNVRLTAFGERYLKENGGGPLKVHDRTEFVFEAGKAQRVTRAGDWDLVLKNVTVAGHPLFEIAPETPGRIIIPQKSGGGDIGPSAKEIAKAFAKEK